MDAILHLSTYFLWIGVVAGSCNPGSSECISIKGYDGYQWATCLTENYIQTKSEGRHKCIENVNTCWYQCMLELHRKEDGLVHRDCSCTRNDPSNRPVALPLWCYSPSGENCLWYRDCLETQYPCKGQDDSFALFSQKKFCK
ncbi:uncharacterized protein LOC128553713, partial [Mercenaria mercenaria]|uniref:uncharacterized protein LOC128553713 n=1 Tax=Mercenaria mercenaria TaxID=6596 RepID=UPI00234F6647